MFTITDPDGNQFDAIPLIDPGLVFVFNRETQQNGHLAGGLYLVALQQQEHSLSYLTRKELNPQAKHEQKESYDQVELRLIDPESGRAIPEKYGERVPQLLDSLLPRIRERVAREGWEVQTQEGDLPIRLKNCIVSFQGEL